MTTLLGPGTICRFLDAALAVRGAVGADSDSRLRCYPNHAPKTAGTTYLYVTRVSGTSSAHYLGVSGTAAAVFTVAAVSRSSEDTERILGVVCDALDGYSGDLGDGFAVDAFVAGVGPSTPIPPTDGSDVWRHEASIDFEFTHARDAVRAP